MEYRTKLSGNWTELSVLDAGNIWTIRNYIGSAGWCFSVLINFFGQLGIATEPVSARDFSFFVLRVDLGLKLFLTGAGNEPKMADKI